MRMPALLSRNTETLPGVAGIARVDRDTGRLLRRVGPGDVVVLDPPRAGAGRTVVDQLVALAPRRIVYLACDPATLARDLGRFRRAGWQVRSVRAFDMYPNTHHVETLAVLEP